MVELSQKVIQNRIIELDHKNKRKAQALDESSFQLEGDVKKLDEFI